MMEARTELRGDYVSCRFWLWLAPAVKFLTIAALHFVRPDANPVSGPISNYGVGPYGFLLTVADIGSGGYSRPSIWPLSRHRTI